MEIVSLGNWQHCVTSIMSFRFESELGLLYGINGCRFVRVCCKEGSSLLLGISEDLVAGRWGVAVSNGRIGGGPLKQRNYLLLSSRRRHLAKPSPARPGWSTR